jgi:hypothetical protein
MKQLILVVLFSIFTINSHAIDTDSTTTDANQLPSYNTGSDWWIEITPDDPYYDLYKDVQVNCFCG